MTHFLQELNYKVDLVDYGQKAIEMAQNILYDLIISNVRNKGLSGKEVIPLIRESKRRYDIIVWSAFVNKKNEDLYLSWEADAALTKFHKIYDLKTTIDECLKQRGYEREYFYKEASITKKWEKVGERLNLLEDVFHLSDEQLALVKDAVEIHSKYKLFRKADITAHSNL